MRASGNCHSSHHTSSRWPVGPNSRMVGTTSAGICGNLGATSPEFRAMRLLVGDVSAGRGDGVHVVGGGGVHVVGSEVWLHPLRSIRTRERRASPQELPKDMQLMAKIAMAIEIEFHRPACGGGGGSSFHVERRTRPRRSTRLRGSFYHCALPTRSLYNEKRQHRQHHILRSTSAPASISSNTISSADS